MANPTLLNSSLRLTDDIFYGDPGGGGGVPTSLVISTTYPIRIDGGASADLSANRTLSIVQSPVAAGQDSVGVNRLIITTAPLKGGQDLSSDPTLFMDVFAGGGAPGYVPDPVALGAGYFLEATGNWVLGTVSGVPSNRTLTMGTGLLIDGVASADLSANRTITTVLFSSTAKGVVPASGGGHTNVLWADGTWATPASGGGFVTLQPSTPGTADVGNAHISGAFLADLAIGANTLAPLGRIHGVQSTTPDPNNSLYAVSAARYAKATTLGVVLGFIRSRGAVSAPTVGNDGDQMVSFQGEFYTTNNGFNLAPFLQVFQDGVNLNAAGIATKMAASDGVSAVVTSWLTAAGLYVKPGTVLTKPAAAASLHVAGSLATDVKLKTASYGITAADEVILADRTAGARIITLPTAVGIAGRLHTIVCVGTGIQPVDIATTSSQTISTFASWRLRSSGEAVTVQSDGSNWQIVSTFDWFYQGASVADGSTLSNSTTDTVIAGNVVWNVFGAGAIFGLKAFGKLSTAATGPTLRLRIHEVGDFVIADSLAITMPGSLTDAMWQMECEWVRRDTTTPSTLRALSGTLTINDGNVVVLYNNVASAYNMAMLAPHTSTFSNGLNTLQLLAQWGTASSSNSITCIESASWAVPGTVAT